MIRTVPTLSIRQSRYDAAETSSGETGTDHLIQENDESLGSGFGNWEAESQQPESGVLNTCKSGGKGTSELHRSRNSSQRNVSGNAEKEVIAGYEGNGLFYADPVKKSDTTGNSNSKDR